MTQTPQERWPVGSRWGWGPKHIHQITSPIERRVLGHKDGQIYYCECEYAPEYMLSEPHAQWERWTVDADAQRLDPQAAREGEGKP